MARHADDDRPKRAGLGELALAFLRLGCLSFGGPIAHLGYLRAEFVERRAWLDDRGYAELVALCQFLPGPASSQVVFALGMHRAGLRGALLASLCFTLPSALLMIAFAYGVADVAGLGQAGWLHGLKLAAVGVVAQAVWGMGRKLCPDRRRAALAIAAAAVLLLAPGAWAQLAVIAGAGVLGWWWYRGAGAVEPADGAAPSATGRRAALAALAVFAALLVGLPVLASTTGAREVAVFDGFYRAGAMVFGGGHVVLPLLRVEVVAPGWLTEDQFLAGYGAAQAVPGPLFSFAGYLGAAMAPGPGAWLSGLWALFAIFLPAWLLVGGALPFWRRLRTNPAATAALAGANAAVVGVLLAALYSPVVTESITGPRDVAAALVAFALLEHVRAPAWLVVGVGAAAGVWLM
jgi:chromate transporter